MFLDYLRYLAECAWFGRIHVSLEVKDGKLRLTKQNHGEFVAAAQKKLDNLDKSDLQTFISKALTIAIHGCNFIIFQTSNDNSPFIQFWTKGGLFKFDFYANDLNGLKRYHTKILKILNPYNCNSSKSKGAWTIEANLGKDLALARQVSASILSGVYKIKLEELSVKVG